MSKQIGLWLGMLGCVVGGLTGCGGGVNVGNLGDATLTVAVVLDDEIAATTGGFVALAEPVALAAQALTQVVVRYEGYDLSYADNCESGDPLQYRSEQPLEFVYGQGATRPVVRATVPVGDQGCQFQLRATESGMSGETGSPTRMMVPGLELRGQLRDGRDLVLRIPRVPGLTFTPENLFVEEGMEVELQLPVRRWVAIVGDCIRTVAEGQPIRVDQQTNREIMGCVRQQLPRVGEVR